MIVKTPGSQMGSPVVAEEGGEEVGGGRWESGERSKVQARSTLSSTAPKAKSRSGEVATLDEMPRISLRVSSSDSTWNAKIKTFQNDRTKISTQTDVYPYLIRLKKCLNLPNFYMPHSDPETEEGSHICSPSINIQNLRGGSQLFQNTGHVREVTNCSWAAVFGSLPF